MTEPRPTLPDHLCLEFRCGHKASSHVYLGAGEYGHCRAVKRAGTSRQEPCNCGRFK